MRDRLIELLGDFPIFHSTMKERWMPEAVERLADHLLSEGVIVPPCKVGQTVYVIQLGKIYECRVNEICIRAGNNNVVVLDRFINGFLIHRYGVEYFNAFGKTVFLTREEAERALERSENET